MGNAWTLVMEDGMSKLAVQALRKLYPKVLPTEYQKLEDLEMHEEPRKMAEQVEGDQ